ncbi:type II/IV secretion system ATPase subunit [Halobacterium litoreum]|uniref:Type II/IV secretion system ATPase subunit n=1 Tax=Halobacterium litoreum TaxID=2039234 RepID=A0ABD5NGX5_9EURY|nr:type II/IV secretion system ATPase subunit [Halobacterium litoreum]UHH12820.1 type II/IV secretion system ATPase subunit [Halobacterium litoreum]
MPDRVESVPAPVPPGDPDAWYAPDVRAQYEVHPGVVVTVAERGAGEFAYDARAPPLSATDEQSLRRVTDYFADAQLSRPRTREGTRERVAAGLAEKHRRVLARLTDCSPAARRRIEFHALCELRGLGDLTPLALDDGVEVADAASDALVVHTADYAPAVTDLPADPPHLDRFLSERLARYTVPFREFEIPVVVYREHVLGRDAFDTKYAVREPDRLPGDDDLVAECKERIWETSVEGVLGDGPDRTEFVAERAREFLTRRLTVRNTRAWLDATKHRIRGALAEYGLAVPPVGRRFSDDRLDDLAYYVLRDFVGDGELTVPIRDSRLEDVEANAVGERVKVVPRGDLRAHGERLPTNLVLDDEQRFVNLVTQLAARDGVELNASNPSAKVNLEPAEVDGDVTIRCAVALPVISENGPHVSIRKQAADALTPVDLLRRDSVSTDVVALLWMAYEHHGVVLFSGPTGAGKTTLMNAHMPFVPFDDRPISIDEGSREVRLPHETGVSLTTRDHEREFKRVSMADLMTETNYLNPDVEVIAEINTRESFESFAQILNTGHGVVGTTHAEDVETLVNRAIEQGVPAYLLREVDLAVFPRHVDGDRYVGEVVELVGDAGPDTETVEKDGSSVHFRRVVEREPGGGFDFAGADDVRFFERLADRTDRSVGDVREEFRQKRRYVEYLDREGVTDFRELFGLLSDLRTDEAATVERLRRRAGE